ncbi:DNA breaking-rejoining enzyme [Suillus discolor]|uniref:DNA breaking-rejoining enzyme n=1 Tax=Suillus discolor TaxID=1912936 RepID=A0A9P7JTG2_9AGAM|nr:DNA breaking-rejoining enzyme [Suillus discolor]KAG2107940.1 DNA breaking-rejoining enzyme [Suillus discolor]
MLDIKRGRSRNFQVNHCIRRVESIHPKPRKPKPNNTIAPSALRPHVLARDRVRLWSAPHSTSFHSSMLRLLPLEDVVQLLDVMLVSIELKTRENYGSGLLHFHQYCDTRKIPEKLRMPVPDHLLASFVASWAGKVASTTVQNWLAELHFWHNLHGAPWNGRSLVRSATAGLSKLVPSSSKRPRRPPITLEHMHALFCHLDLSNTFDVSVFAVASTAFWSCCRLGELIIDSALLFNPSRHVSRSAPLRRGTSSTGVSFIVITIPWTKTTHGDGANLVASRIDDHSNSISALNHHLLANTTVLVDAPFFTFETENGGWAPMMRTWFMNHCNQVWKQNGLAELSGHCFRIGGATELLLQGTPPDVVAMQGRWKSRAFLEYWRKIDSILPMFVSSTFSNTCLAMMQSAMDSFSCCYK